MPTNDAQGIKQNTIMYFMQHIVVTFQKSYYFCLFFDWCWRLNRRGGQGHSFDLKGLSNIRFVKLYHLLPANNEALSGHI